MPEQTRIKRTKCRFCGRWLIWVPSAATGKLVPLDAGAANGGVVFQIVRDEAGRLFALQLQLPESSHLNHWVTCPKADEARKAKKAMQRAGRT